MSEPKGFRSLRAFQISVSALSGNDLPCKFSRGLPIRLIRLSFVEAFEFTLAVKLTLIHFDADLVRLRFHFFVGGIEHRRGAEVDDPANHVLVQPLNKMGQSLFLWDAGKGIEQMN